MAKLKIEYFATSKLVPYSNNARTHSDAQIEQIANSIREFGFTNPVLVDQAWNVVAGHGRLEAAKLLGLDDVPCIRLGHLSDRQRRAYVLADNRIALGSGWDFEKLSEELSYLSEVDFDLSLTGFAEDELDALLKSDEGIIPNSVNGATVVAGHERKLPDGNFDDKGVGYKSQYGVIVMCESEDSQAKIYERLTSEGFKCKIVVT